MALAADLPIALLPVLLFLLALVFMDSFKLVPGRAVLQALVAGAMSAAVCLALHGAILQTGIHAVSLRRYIAPFTEETAKAAFIVWLLARRRLGFGVDAAIQGFAVGAGFAVVENLDYLRMLGDARIWVWLVRGLGTAVLHGAASSIFAMLARGAAERRPDRRMRGTIGAWLAAVALHTAFNVGLLPPLASSLVLLTALPVLMLYVFHRSERSTSEWVRGGLDLDLELLDLVSSPGFADTRFGRYLHELRQRLGGPIAADMFCLLRVELELSVQARAMLMAREAGLELPPDEDLRISVAELDYLRDSIGRTGLLALKPLRVTTDRDQWHRYVLRHLR